MFCISSFVIGILSKRSFRSITLIIVDFLLLSNGPARFCCEYEILLFY